MSAAELKNCVAGDVLANGQYYRVTFEPWIPAWLDAGTRAATFAADIAELHASLTAGKIAYLTPIAPPSPLPGQTVAVITFRVFSPPGRLTVADLASALEHAKVSISVKTIERIPARDTAADREQVQRQEQDDQDKDSLPDQLLKFAKRLGVVLLLAIVVLVILHFSRKS